MQRPDRKYLWALNAVGLRLRGVSIQFPSYIGPTLYLYGRKHIKIGKRVRVWPGLRVEVHNGATVRIEDDVMLGPYCHIVAGADLTIGTKSTYAGWNLISNVNHSLNELELHALERPWEISPTVLGERLFVGQGAKILAGSHLGDASAVGANAVVSRLKAPANSVVVGIPARVIRDGTR